MRTSWQQPPTVTLEVWNVMDARQQPQRLTAFRVHGGWFSVDMTGKKKQKFLGVISIQERVPQLDNRSIF